MMDERRRVGLLLVVDDEAGMRETLTDILEEFDLTAEVAANGREAVDKVMARDYLLVIMDIRMPEMSGTEALAAMAACRPGLPVIMMSACPDAEARELVVKHQARALVGKPMDLGVLLTLIQDIVRERLAEHVVAGDS
jgi:DNA-binding NtrC family response regulator